MKKTVSLSFMLLSILFCVCLITANLLEIKVIKIGSLPLSVTAGMLVFPVSYIINDCIAEVWGFRKARLIIWVGFLANFFVMAMAQLAVMLPAAEFWDGEIHLCVRHGSTHCCCQPDCIPCRLVLQCLCHEPYENSFQRKEFLTACSCLNSCR